MQWQYDTERNCGHNIVSSNKLWDVESHDQGSAPGNLRIVTGAADGAPVARQEKIFAIRGTSMSST